MSNLYRMIPDGRKGGGTLTTTGKAKVTVSANSFADLPLEDASRLDGWTSCGVVGTTAQRPTNARNGEHFIDITLSKVIFADGLGNWHDPFTGGVV